MHLKSAVKYNLYENKKALIIFYGIILFLTFALHATLRLALNGEAQGNVVNMDSSSAIFIMVVGITSFNIILQFFLQSGVSRKTYFLSTLLTFLILAVAMSAADIIIRSVADVVFNASNINNASFVGMAYGHWFAGKSQLFIYMTEFLLRWMVYLLFGMLGVFFGAFFYRLSKLMRVLVGAGVPVLLIIVLPVVDATLTKGEIFRAIGNFFLFITGFKNGGNPYFLTAFSLIGTALIGAVTWLLVRRATGKS